MSYSGPKGFARTTKGIDGAGLKAGLSDGARDAGGGGVFDQLFGAMTGGGGSLPSITGGEASAFSDATQTAYSTFNQSADWTIVGGGSGDGKSNIVMVAVIGGVALLGVLLWRR